MWVINTTGADSEVKSNTAPPRAHWEEVLVRIYSAEDLSLHPGQIVKSGKSDPDSRNGIVRQEQDNVIDDLFEKSISPTPREHGKSVCDLQCCKGGEGTRGRDVLSPYRSSSLRDDS